MTIKDTHVYPLTTIHDIDHGLKCWCKPYRDRLEPSIIIHRPVARA